jgi:hypothetical protein
MTSEYHRALLSWLLCRTGVAGVDVLPKYGFRRAHVVIAIITLFEGGGTGMRKS